MGKTGRPRIAAWLPLLVFAALSCLVILLWRTLDRQEKAAARAKVQVEADYLASHIDADLRNRLPALKRMARLWDIRSGLTREEFEADAASYIADCPGFQAIEFVDRSSVVRWIVPFAGNEKAVGLDLNMEKNRREALEKARTGGQPTMSAPIDLVQGGKGFLAYFPAFDGDEYEGCVLAVFRISEWLDYVFSVKSLGIFYRGDCRVSVSYDGEPVFAQEGWTELEKRSDLASQGSLATASIAGHELNVRVIPTEDFLARSGNPLPAIVAVSGIVFSALLAFIILLMQRESAVAEEANAARTALEADIAEREKLELRLQETLVRVDLATKAGGMGVWTWDVATGKLTWNERMFDLFEIAGDVSPTYETWKNAVHPDDVAIAESLLDDAVHGRAKFDTEFRIIVAGGRIRNIRAAARVIRRASGEAEYVTGLNWDVTDMRQAEETIRHMATHDALTDLPTMRLFRDRLSMAINLARRRSNFVAVLFIDLDGFKAVNDTYGHAAGDAVLREVAARLSAAVRDTDTVARMGGDEFLLVLTELGAPGQATKAAKVAEKVIESISRPIMHGGTGIKVGSSVGISIFPDDGADVDRLVKRADDAMYRVKNSGKNGYRFAGGAEPPAESPSEPA